MRWTCRPLVLAMFAACGGDAVVPGTLEVTPTVVDFGRVPVGGTAVVPLSLTNLGTEPLDVYSVTLVSGDGAVFRVDSPGAFALPGGESMSVDITASPTEVGDAAGRVQVRSSDTAVTVDLAAQATPSEADADEDGFSPASGDCDDSRDDVYPGAPERCDGRDNDCDGAIPAGEADTDRDGFRLCDDDCDDDDDRVYPGALEICDGKDSDCDGVVADDLDADTDGTSICEGDCDDGDPRVAPGLLEVCDGVDNDCDGGADDLDGDGDGHGLCHAIPDCDDDRPEAHPVLVDPAAAPGGDGTESQPFATLTDALAHLDGVCNLVGLVAGTHEASSTLSSDVTLRGAGVDATTLVAPVGARHLTVTGGAVALEDLTLTGGTPTEDGGAIRVTGGAVTLARVDVTDNTSTGGDGGAIAVGGGATLVLEDVRVTGNVASDDGGGIAVSDGTLIAVRAAFIDNAGVDGGAVYASGTHVELVDCVVDANIAAGDGGGLLARGSDTIILERTAFWRNSAQNGGGALLDGTSVFRQANGA